jgi:NUMOD3 motif
LKPEYNILQKAGSSLGYKHSEETLIKMKSHKFSAFGEQTKNYQVLIRVSFKAFLERKTFAKNHSEETRAKLFAAKKDSCQKI